MAVQDIIKHRRKELGLTLKEVAEKLNVSEGTVSRYESGDIQNMGIDKIATLAKALQCSPGYLMGWEKEPTSRTGSPAAVSPSLSLDPEETRLINTYRSFNATGKAKLMDYLSDLDSSPRNHGDVLDSFTGLIEKDNLA